MKKKTFAKRIFDIILAVLLLFLMAYQVTGDFWHEWIGIAMTVLVAVHHIINIRWYGALFKGRYNAYRIIITTVDFLLLACFVLSALTGVSMSAHAVPFFNGLIPMMTAMKLHLGISWWSFVLMSIHIGLHLRPVFAGLKVTKRVKLIVAAVLILLGAAGLTLLVVDGIPSYLAFKTHFATHTCDLPAAVVLLKNIVLMFPGLCIAILTCPGKPIKNNCPN